MTLTYQVANNGVIHEFLDNEIILANLDNGIYYSIRESGIPIWQLLINGQNISDITKILAERYSLSAENSSQAINDLLQKLLSESLLKVNSSELKINLDPNQIFWPEKFQTALFEKYEDMQNLLMLDPIHEVDEQGWPHKSADV